ncbi:MAG: GGDEF domain-containing protein [Gammaproteobacteria bacterium]|nr:GGDEF domain-containing protein [Gammaproteobacteria bacterium]
MIIDIPTSVIFLISINFALAVMIATVGYGRDKSLLLWGAAFGINSLAFAMLSMRGTIPDFLSIVVANTLIASTYALFAEGILSFQNRRIKPWLVWTPVLIILVSFPFLLDDINTRVVLLGVVNAAQNGIPLYLLLTSPLASDGRGDGILKTAMTAGIFVALIRPGAILLGQFQLENFNTENVVQTLTFLPITILHVCVATGMLLMQKEYAEWKARMIASHDELTGLPNRRHFYEQMQQAIVDGKMTQEFGAVILFDLDNFKILNDSHGHSVGDALLRQAATRITQTLGTSGNAARLGGDEFVILLTNLGHEYKAAAADARAVAESLSKRLAEIYTLDKHNAQQQLVQQINHRSTGSFGIKVFNPLLEQPGQILHHADQAMYEAKNHQKGSICLFQG